MGRCSDFIPSGWFLISAIILTGCSDTEPLTKPSSPTKAPPIEATRMGVPKAAKVDFTDQRPGASKGASSSGQDQTESP
ncbi:MAG: hypothetical protein ACK526_08410 [Planctomyces sp.]